MRANVSVPAFLIAPIQDGTCTDAEYFDMTGQMYKYTDLFIHGETMDTSVAPALLDAYGIEFASNGC